MPTVKTIKPLGGGDYTSLQDWWDWAKTQSNADQWAECYGGGSLGALDTSGGYSFTPTSTDYVRIYAASGHRHNLAFDTSKAHIDVGDVGDTDAYGIIWHVNYGRIEGLQIKGEGFVRLLNDYNNAATNGVGGPYHYLDLLVIGGAGATDNKALIDIYIRGGAGNNAYIRNCTFVRLGYFAGFTQNGECKYYIDNCEFINCGGFGGLSATRWALTNFETHEMKNSAILNTNGAACVDTVFYIGTVEFFNCFITDESITDLGWSQTDCVENGTAAGQLVDIDADWKTLGTSDFVGAGLDLSAEFTKDALGNTRTVPWWIGPHQPAPLPPSPLRRIIADYDLAEPINRANPMTAGLQLLLAPVLGPGIAQVDLVRHHRYGYFFGAQEGQPQPTFARDPALGGVYRFAGGVVAPKSARPWSSGGGPYTFGMLIKPGTRIAETQAYAAGYLTIASAIGDNPTGFSLRRSSTGQTLAIFARPDGESSTTSTITADEDVQQDVWSLLLITYDGDTARLVIGGETVGSVSAPGHAVSVTDGLYLGYDEAVDPYHGDMSFVGLWSRVLNSRDITRLSQPEAWFAMLNKSKRTRRYTAAVSTSVVMPVTRVNQVSDVPGPVAVW